MKKIIVVLIILVFAIGSIDAKTTKTTKTKAPPKKKSMMSKIGDAATRGFGWGLGREAAKETIKGAKVLYQKGTEKSKEVLNKNKTNEVKAK
jgi:hypothetical protein